MKLVSLAVCRATKTDKKAVILCQETDTSITFFGKNNVREMCRFIAREITLRVKAQEMASLKYKDFYSHVYKELSGLTVVAITDNDYPSRSAHGLIQRILDDFNKSIKIEEWSIANDFKIQWKHVSTYLQQWSSPPKDKLQQVQQNIDETKKIVTQSIEKVLQNMEKLDDLVAKSADLSNSSRMFYKKSKKLNRCCIIL